MSEQITDPQDLARTLVAREHLGDASGMAVLYTPDAVLDRGDGQMAIGREAIRAFFTRLIEAGIKFELGEQRPAIVNGDLALTSTRLPNGTVTAEVASRQTDGSWLWVIDQPRIHAAHPPRNSE